MGPVRFRLGQNKGLFLRELFTAALACYESIAADALVVAPDVWVEAVYGMAECLRVGDQLAAASHRYSQVLSRAPLWLETQGRLRRSNHMAVVQSSLWLVEIGRLSLRVNQTMLREFIAAGYEVARTVLERDLARLPFQFADLLLLRHEASLALVDQRAEQLVQQLDKVTGGPCLLDKDRVHLWRLEVLQEARLPAQERAAPPDHFAARWGQAVRSLLRARRNLERKDRTAAQRALDDARPLVASYPDLGSIHSVLAVVASGLAIERTALLAGVRQKLWAQVNAAFTGLADLSTPIWCLGWLVLAGRSVAGLWGELGLEIELLARVLGRAPWLTDTLLSRGMDREALARLRAGKRALADTPMSQQYAASLAVFCKVVHP